MASGRGADRGFGRDRARRAAKALVQDLFGTGSRSGRCPRRSSRPAGRSEAGSHHCDRHARGRTGGGAGGRALTDARRCQLLPALPCEFGARQRLERTAVRRSPTKRGLSYGSYSGLDARADAGLLTASAQTKHETADEVVKVILDEFGKLASAPADEAWLEKRRVFITGGRAARWKPVPVSTRWSRGCSSRMSLRARAILLAQRLAEASTPAGRCRALSRAGRGHAGGSGRCVAIPRRSESDPAGCRSDP